MTGMFTIALIITNQFYLGKTEQTTSILLAANGLGGSIPPIAVGWRLDEFSVHTALVIYNSHVNHAGDILVLKVLENLKSKKLDKMDTDENKSVQI